MKPARTLITPLILALLLSSAPTTGLRLTQAAEPQVGGGPTSPLLAEGIEREATQPPSFSILGAPSVTQPPGNWHIEIVDSTKLLGPVAERGMRLDSDGHPHIVYGDNNLYHTWHDGIQWHYEVVEEYGDYGSASLALDGAGQPHTSYNDSTNGLKYAWHDGTGWQIETVDNKGGYHGYSNTSLALDGSGQPHISYVGDGGLKYAWHDGATWYIETVDSKGWVGHDTSLALDGSGQPHISYVGNTDLKYAWHDGATWYIETVDSKGWVGYNISLALDSSGRPHISYWDDYPNYELKYAWHDGTGWHIEIADSDGALGMYSSLALDESDRPHISYCNSTNGDLKYAWHDGTSWHIEAVIDALRASYGYCSPALALDEAGRPHISYSDGGLRIRYARHDGVDWQVETVDVEKRLTPQAPLALDGLGRPHISYYARYARINDSSEVAVEYAYRDGTTWHSETVDDTVWSGYSGSFISLALDASGRPHIGYHNLHSCDDYCSHDLKYAWRDGTGWQIETVENAGLNTTDASLALDGSGRPHITYHVGEPIYDLMYAWHDGTNWYTETVDSTGDVGQYTSLALDGADRPHVSYVGNDYLKYAWHDGSSWHIETVDNERWVRYPSLALDGLDRPHISYYDDTNGDLKYAWHDGTSWHIEIVDSEGDPDNSLALDGSDRPHISYRRWGGDSLKYAWHDGTGWQIETVDSGFWAGQYPSLALDGAGQPHISYFDDSVWDDNKDALKYAWRMPPTLSLHKRATPSEGLRNNEALTYTLVISSPGLSVRLWDPLPANVQYVSGSITSTLTPPAIYSPTLNAVIWQGALPTGAIQTVRFQVTPGITGTEALSLSAPIANTAWLTDTENNRGVSATVIVNGRRVYLPLVLRQFQ